jgi:Ala-tRNA(Pro) deacylase
MNKKNVKKNDMITKAREHTLFWLLCLIIVVGFLVGTYFYLGDLYPDDFEYIAVLLLGGAIFIIYYFMYIFVFAELYKCDSCGKTFYISFSKVHFLKFYGFRNRYMNGFVSDEYLWWKKVKCPYCGGMVEFDKNVVEEDMNNNLTLYDVLNHLDISYDEIEHEKVVTIEDAIKVSSKIDGFGTKSLFLTDGNHFYLVVLSEFKRANMKELAKLVGCKKLSFASNYDLDSTLGLEEGSVTPLGIMNDKYKEVTILIDKDLVNCKVLLHPNVNTKTISITCADLIRYIEYFEHEYIIF